MLFTYFGVIAASALAVVSALPLPSHHTSLDCKSNPSGCLTENEALVLNYNSREIPVELDLFKRARTWEQRQGKKQVKQDKKTAKAEQGKKNAQAERAKAKVTFGKSARGKLDELGLHGKERQQAKNYHKKVVKEDMKKNGLGAVKAKVVHLDHEGGNVKEEKSHITAHFYDKHHETIHSHWTDKSGEHHTADLHHVYPDKHNLKQPKSFSDAAAKSQRKKWAVAAATTAAEKTLKKEHDAKLEEARITGQAKTDAQKEADRANKKANKKAAKADRAARASQP